MKTIRVVAALIPDRHDRRRLLVQQRLPGKARANLWEFPGGKVEPGESDEAALVREGFEELGVELKVGAQVWAHEHEYSDVRVCLVLFAAEIVAGDAKPLGAQAIRFLTPDEMKQVPFCEADLNLIETLQTGAIRLP